ncbi:MAG: hypothetical protein MK193_13360 [Lentisphaeria bacterium]|nr:hypothetical protein [Lentisphaeria bacterium]
MKKPIKLLSALLLSANYSLINAAGKVPATAWGITPDQRAIDSGIFIKPQELAQSSKLKFSVTEPSGIDRIQYPVRGSLPFFRGEINENTNFILKDAAGNAYAVQAKPVAYWPEKTTKFVCFDFLVDIKANEKKNFVLEYGQEIEESISAELQIAKTDSSISVDTKRLSFSISKGKSLTSEIKLDNISLGDSGIASYMNISTSTPESKPQSHLLMVNDFTVIEQGPVQVTIHLKAQFTDEKSASLREDQNHHPKFPVDIYLTAYANSSRLDFIYSFGFNADEFDSFIRQYGVFVPQKNGDKFIFGSQSKTLNDITFNKDLVLSQPNPNSWSLNSNALSGKRISGWAGIQNKDQNTIVALRNAWQQWPVQFRAIPNKGIYLDIYGANKDHFLDLRFKKEDKKLTLTEIKHPKMGRVKVSDQINKSQSMYNGEVLSSLYNGDLRYKAGGLRKISEFTIDFDAKKPANVGNAQHKMLIPWPGKKRWAETRVFGLTGYFPDSNDIVNLEKNFNYHALNLVDLPLVQHESLELYGWVDYPDSLDVVRPKKGDTNFNLSRFSGGEGWTNGEKANQGVISLYLASGWRRAWDHGHQSLLHTIGFDLEHVGGDQAAGVSHRHCQVHWSSGGSPRQSGCFIGWHWYYWLSGHNEIGRILDANWQNPLGISAKTGSQAQWPFHNSYNMEKDFNIPADLEKGVAYSAKGVIYHWVNFNRWQTNQDPSFVNYFESLFNGLKQNPYKKKPNGDKTFNPVMDVSFVSDRQYVQSPGRDEIPSNPTNPEEPHFYDYYFRSYYGKSLIAEWAQLTGSKHAIDLMLLMGDWDFLPRSKPVVSESRYKDKLQWLYKSHGVYMSSYYLLRKDQPAYKEHIENLLGLIEARTRVPYNEMSPIMDPESYTFKQWNKNFKNKPFEAKPYGKNGIKNVGGHMNEVLGNLWFYTENFNNLDETQKEILQKQRP